MKEHIALFFFLALPTSSIADGYGFMTPSGNIFCNGAVERSAISCTIVERMDPPARPRPASCTATWGHTFNLSATGEAELACTDAPSRVNYTDIAIYGATGEFGDITCQSESTGLTCRNREGRGFFLSRSRQSAF
jgi:hypothetical protein